MITLERGKTYRARIELGFFESQFGNEVVQVALEEFGFIDVRVTGDGMERWVEGVWDRDELEHALPSVVTHVEVVVINGHSDLRHRDDEDC